MEQWTREEKNQILSAKDEKRLSALHNEIKQSIWRTGYHIQTVTGLLNDPNGFSYFNNQWHLFYQWFPFGAVHGMKHWYHVTSEDMVHWKNEGLGLRPDIKYDNYGCYSGSGFVKEDYLYMVYTGNHRNKAYQRVPYQLICALDKKGTVTKLNHPIILPEEGYTEHQRDPKIFLENGSYYILLGAQDSQQHGKMLIYKSAQIATGWKFAGELKVEGYESFGFMVECPSIAKIGDKWLLLFSPQGLERQGDEFCNAYANVYLVGDLDLDTLTFKPDGPMKELDRGFDFYAAQTAAQNVYEDTAILSGWFGCSDYTYPPTDEEGWAGLLSLPRELTIEDGQLRQRPARNLESLKKNVVFQAEQGKIVKEALLGRTPAQSIMHLDNPSGENVAIRLFSTNRKNGFLIEYNSRTKTFSIDRSDLVNQFNEKWGTKRKMVLENGLESLDIYVDHSAIEIFINDGEAVMSSRVFPTDAEHFIRLSGKDINLTIWTAETAVQDDCVLFPAQGEQQ